MLRSATLFARLKTLVRPLKKVVLYFEIPMLDGQERITRNSKQEALFAGQAAA